MFFGGSKELDLAAPVSTFLHVGATCAENDKNMEIQAAEMNFLRSGL